MTQELDRVVRRAQAGDDAALRELLALLRGPLSRQVRRLGVRAADVDDVVQEALVDVSRGLGGYGWRASFLGWAYAIAARRAWRRTAADGARAAAERLEGWLAAGEDPLDAHELLLVAQDAHLRCTLAVAGDLSRAQRKAYLLGEVLGVPDTVGADALQISPAAFRQRVSRARRLVNARTAPAGDGEEAVPGDPEPVLLAELARLDTLGQLHRARGRPASAEGALRALRRAAPGLDGG